MLDFLKRATGPREAPPAAPPGPDAMQVEDHAAALQFRAKSGVPIVLPDRPQPSEELPDLLEDLALGKVVIVEPRAAASADAAPTLQRPREAMQWLEAHGADPPVGRHAVLVLESAGAADLAVDTLVCALLDGDVDTAGYPLDDAIVGGFASRWDEASGDLLVRPLVAWGGHGARSVTERQAQRLLAALATRVEARARPGHVAGEHAGLLDRGLTTQACPHCGFGLTSGRALFCPKCGMRIGRG